MSGKRAWPRCSAEGCTRAVREVPGNYSGARLPEADGLCSGHVPKPAPDVPTLGHEEPEAVVDDSPASTERIASLRDALREGVLTDEVATLVRDQLLEGLRASKSIFVTCPDCKHRHPVVLPDLSTRITATQKLIEEVEGKLAAKQEDVKTELQRDADELLRRREELSDEELALAIATLEREIADARA